MIGLRIKRTDDETWLECALRYGSKFGVEVEVREAYDHYITEGDTEEEAAFSACYDWDICEVVEDEET